MPAIPHISIAKYAKLLSPRAASLNNFPQTRSLSSSDITSHIPASLRSLSQSASTLTRRQNVQGIIPTYYQIDGPSPGTVAGIVLGSVAGFLLIIWLLMALTNNGSGVIEGEEEVVVRRRDRSPRSRRSRHSTRGVEVREVSRSPRRERIIVEERPPPRRSRSIVVEERMETRVPGDDIVEVIEEHSDITPPRRKRSHRNSGYRY